MADQPLGRLWQPYPFSWTWRRAEANGERLNILQVDTPVGVIGLPFTPEDLTRFIDMAVQFSSGMVIASSVDER